MPEYFDRYINLVEDVELNEAIDQSLVQLNAFDLERLKKLDHQIYDEGKWTAKTILQHIIDFERILTYRTLLFARREGNPVPGVEEDVLGANCRAERRSYEDLVAELKAVRQATKLLFESFDEEMLHATGINWKFEVSVLAMGFTIVGHQLHHMKIIEERYFPLVS